jgi:alkaline phosphatase
VSSSHSRRASTRRPRRAIAVGAVLLVVIASAAVAVATTGLGGNDDEPAARNVILFVGDGMGDSEITSARNYEYGTGGRFPGIDALPHQGRFTTHSLNRDGSPDYVADSAATATAWATGTKTHDGAVGVDVDDQSRPTLLELAKKKGLRTGNVTTSAIQDATPAALMAHVPARSCQGPEETSETCPDSALENGGPGSITEQMLRTRPDVTLGGGFETLEEEAAESGEYAGVTLLEQAERRGFQLVEDADSLAAVETADQKSPLLGLFAEGNLPTSWVGPKATRTGGEEPAVRCELNDNRPSSLPSLAQMTEKAISLLDGEKGFFLQVESASIDKSGHAADVCGQIGEMIALDEAVQAARAFAEKDARTTILVTADHAQASQIVQAGANTRGLTATLLTKEGAPMTVSFGSAVKGQSQAHTGVQVPIAGEGPNAAEVADLDEQTDLFDLISRLLRLKD